MFISLLSTLYLMGKYLNKCSLNECVCKANFNDAAEYDHETDLAFVSPATVFPILYTVLYQFVYGQWVGLISFSLLILLISRAFEWIILLFKIYFPPYMFVCVCEMFVRLLQVIMRLRAALLLDFGKIISLMHKRFCTRIFSRAELIQRTVYQIHMCEI